MTILKRDISASLIAMLWCLLAITPAWAENWSRDRLEAFAERWDLAVQQHNDTVLTPMFTPEAKITLEQNEQTWTLPVSDYLQQIKAKDAAVEKQEFYGLIIDSVSVENNEATLHMTIVEKMTTSTHGRLTGTYRHTLQLDLRGSTPQIKALHSVLAFEPDTSPEPDPIYVTPPETPAPEAELEPEQDIPAQTPSASP